MPRVPFDTLPEMSRVWIFGADRPLADADAERLLRTVDRFLESWAAHGTPLRAGRDWRDDRFLVVAVDQSTAGASGCSIDGLFRQLQGLEGELGVGLVGGGRMFVRDPDGAVRLTSRPELKSAARAGELLAVTPVFDLTVQTLGEFREKFERPARESWAAALLDQSAT